MKRILLFALLLSVPILCQAQASSPAQRVNKAVQAMGGEAALAQLKTLTVRAKVREWEPHQSVKAGGDMRFANESVYSQARDLTSGAARTEWERNFEYPAKRTYKYTEVLSGGIGYVAGIDSTGRTKQDLSSNPPQHTMSGMRVTTATRELTRGSPTLLLAMKRNANAVGAAPDQKVGGKSLPAVRYRAATADFIVLFDPMTGLPERIRTRDYEPLEGDSNYDLVLSDWRAVDGVKYPFRQVVQLNGKSISETSVEEASFTAPVEADRFAIPADYSAGAPKMVDAKNVPFQWVLRRPIIGTLLDSDAVLYDAQANPGGLRLVDVAPGVSHVQGGSHNSLIVEMDKYLVVFDAPIGEAQSKWTIAAAKQKYPGKPFKYVVMTHHHMDHSNGIRSYAAEGATVVVGPGNGAFFRKVLASPATLGRDAPKKKVSAKVVEVTDRYVITDGKREVGAYSIDNPHAAGYLMGYIPDVKLGFVTDLWSPGRDALPPKMNPALQSVVNGVKKWNLDPERFAGGHGAVGEYAGLAKLAESGSQ
jgi:glyoxylase-like metal-dependent hydrolase (beta-lactamase superfamily II)